jgi:hypothetical protein
VEVIATPQSLFCLAVIHSKPKTTIPMQEFHRYFPKTDRKLSFSRIFGRLDLRGSESPKPAPSLALSALR